MFGLSLCIQGTQKDRRPHLVSFRFIPVYTGNTLFSAGFSVGSSVYPCVYREHVDLSNLQILLGGLSLCIQGTLCPLDIDS